jgi:hypothetical protein
MYAASFEMKRRLINELATSLRELETENFKEIFELAPTASSTSHKAADASDEARRESTEAYRNDDSEVVQKVSYL